MGFFQFYRTKKLNNYLRNECPIQCPVIFILDLFCRPSYTNILSQQGSADLRYLYTNTIPCTHYKIKTFVYPEIINTIEFISDKQGKKFKYAMLNQSTVKVIFEK